MARTDVPLTPIVLNTALADPAGTNADATNHHVVTLTKPLSRILLRVTHTTGSTKTLTVKAGDNPPADAAGAGDLTVSFTDGSTTPVIKFLVLSSDRFQQNDGTLSIDLASGFTGKIAAFSFPAGA